MVKINFDQLVGEVKERNRFYKTIIAIKEIAIIANKDKNCSLEDYKAKLKQIEEKCNYSLKGII